MEYDKHIKEHNIEQLAARLLFDLTRNTGFEVSKGLLVNVGSSLVVSGKSDKRMIFADWMITGCLYLIK